MPKQHPIVIEDSDLSSGTLTLSDGGTTVARRRDSIAWTITAPKVDSFKIKKKHSRNIFFTPPPDEHRKHLEKDVWLFAPYGDYEYSIFWKDTDGNHHEYDPKISVKPTPYIPFIKKLVGVISFLGIAYLIFLRRKKK